jgi:hypothetical protein
MAIEEILRYDPSLQDTGAGVFLRGLASLPMAVD